MRAARALTRAASRDLFLHKMASPVLLIERHAPGVRLSCPKKCEEQDAAKIFNRKCPEHECRDHFLSNPASGLQNKSDRRVCRHFAARVTITFYTASARFQLAARSVALC